MTDPLVYTTAEIQRELKCGRATAQRIARELGVRISPRRIVVPRARLEAWLAGREDQPIAPHGEGVLEDAKGADR